MITTLAQEFIVDSGPPPIFVLFVAAGLVFMAVASGVAAAASVVSAALISLVLMVVCAAIAGAAALLATVPVFVAWRRNAASRWWITLVGPPSMLFPPAWLCVVAWSLFGKVRVARSRFLLPGASRAQKSID